MRNVFLALAVLTCATPAALADPAPALQNPAIHVQADAARLRAALTKSSADAFALLSADERAILTRAMRGNRGAAADEGWRFALSPSVQMSDVRSNEALVAWWSPAIDGGMATRWMRAGANWRLTQAAAFTGESLRRQTQSRGGPAWMRVDEPAMPAALQDVMLATRAAVRAGGLARMFTLPSAQSQVLGRAYGAYQTTVRETQAARSAVAFTRQLLIHSDTMDDQGFTELHAALRAMPTAARLQFAPYLAARRGGEATWLWSTPEAPDRVALMTFRDQPESQPVLTNVAVVDLAGAFNTGASQ